MCEVKRQNFKDKLPEIKSAIDSAKFISIDLEFSALNPLKNYQPSLFDSPAERYKKLRKNLEQVCPVQVGLTTFSFDSDKNIYNGKVFNFPVIPAPFTYLNTAFYFQSHTISFLTTYKFDFNKFAYDGVPFISKEEEQELRQKFENNEISEVESTMRMELEKILDNEGNLLQKWLKTSKEGDKLTLPNINNSYKDNYELLYFVHKIFRNRYKYIWTSIENNEFTVKIVSQKDFEKLSQICNLEDMLLRDLKGFTEVFQHITSARKPIIGHNVLQDIMLMINSFEKTLPHSYREFKKLTSSLFPIIFDTKTISYELKNTIPEIKRYSETGLNTLFEYFKNEQGRHLVMNSPQIDLVSDVDNYGRYHEAGWDSFCTGYIFIRFAYLNIAHKYPKSKKFVTSELLGGLEPYKNKINVIRGSTAHINIDGEDPMTSRPPWLIIENVKNKRLDIAEAASLLSTYGFVELKKISYKNNGAIVAVDNFGNARRILNNFKAHKDFRVLKYNFLKHSPVLRTFILSSITISAISGAVLLWMTQGHKR